MKYIAKNRFLGMLFGLILMAGFVLPAGFSDAQTSVKPLRVTTRSGAQNITDTTAVLEGSVDPDKLTTTVWFEWGPALKGLVYRTDFQYIGRGDTRVDFLSGLAGLSPGSVYFFRAVAQNANGIFYGSTERFQTKSAPKAGSASGGFTLFKTQSASAEETANGPLLMSVTVSSDKTQVERGEIFVYNITYRNLGTEDADNVILTVTLPQDLSLDVAAPICYTTTKDKNLVFNLGRVPADQANAVGIRVATDSTAKIGKELKTTAILSYQSTDGTVSAEDSDTLTVTVSAQTPKSATAAAGSIAGSATLWFFTSLILAFLLIAHIYYTRRKIKFLLNA